MAHCAGSEVVGGVFLAPELGKFELSYETSLVVEILCD